MTVFALYLLIDGQWQLESRYARLELAEWKRDKYVEYGKPLEQIRIEEEEYSDK